MKSAKFLNIFIFILCFSLISYGQRRQFILKDVETAFSKSQIIIFNTVKSKGYVLDEYDPDDRSYHYRLSGPSIGNVTADIGLGFSKTKTLILFQWVEYRGYQDIILGELLEAGYEVDNHLQSEYSRVYNN